MNAAHRRSRAGLCLLLATHGGLLMWSAAMHSPTYDEPFHLAADVRRVVEGRFDLDLGNPPLPAMVAAVPVALASAETDWRRFPETIPVGYDFVAANGRRIFWLVTLARWACIPFSLLGGYVCFRWARELYGEASGWLALILWCFCPNVLAHGALVTADMAAASLGLTACCAFWRWLELPTWASAGWAGLGLGLAELTKYVWLPLYFALPAVWMVWGWSSRRDIARPRWRRQAAQLAGVLLLSVYVINFGYFFEATPQPLRRFASGAHVLRKIGAQRDDSPLHWLGSVPVPLPSNYVRGVELVDQWFDRTHRSYLHGQWSERGWWYYYLVGLGLKVPLGTWLLLLLTLGLSLADRRYNAGLRTELLLPAFAVSLVLFVSVVTTDQSHVRFVLPALPFLFVWAGKTARALTLRSWRVAAAVGACLTWTVFSSLSIYPHSLSYFDELAGGPKGGHDWLLDSNIDWGQDLLYLKRWLDAQPNAGTLHLAYFGFVDPRLAGIEFQLPPSATELATRGADRGTANRRVLKPGWYAISVNLLHGYSIAISDGHGALTLASPSDYTYFQRFTPVAMAGYSIYIYHLDQHDIDDLRGGPSSSP